MPYQYDRTEGQRDARKWKKEDYKGFLKAFADLERVQPRPDVPNGTSEPDAGTERVMELIEQMLGRAREGL
jgi:hypothetical protein